MPTTKALCVPLVFWVAQTGRCRVVCNIGDETDTGAEYGHNRFCRAFVVISQCLISFGSNLGDRRDLVARAARLVDRSGMVIAGDRGLETSRLFETPPIGGPGGQSPFLNAVAAFETRASAHEVLRTLKSIESQLGRQRKERWGSRTIDLDVVLHGNLVGGGTGLIVPHPRYTARQFVLQPACDVASDFRDPRFGWSLKRLAEHLSAGVPSLALVGGDLATRAEICQRLTDEFGIVTFPPPPVASSMGVIANAPAGTAAEMKDQSRREFVDGSAASDSLSPGGSSIEVKASGVPLSATSQIRHQISVATDGDPWVSAYLPDLPPLDSDATKLPNIPRLVARLQISGSGVERGDPSWPPPHQMWPAAWRWPEYRLEIDDLRWAASEVASAIDSMRCQVEAVTQDGRWW